MKEIEERKRGREQGSHRLHPPTPYPTRLPRLPPTQTAPTGREVGADRVQSSDGFGSLVHFIRLRRTSLHRCSVGHEVAAAFPFSDRDGVGWRHTTATLVVVRGGCLHTRSVHAHRVYSRLCVTLFLCVCVRARVIYTSTSSLLCLSVRSSVPSISWYRLCCIKHTRVHNRPPPPPSAVAFYHTIPLIVSAVGDSVPHSTPCCPSSTSFITSPPVRCSHTHTLHISPLFFSFRARAGLPACVGLCVCVCLCVLSQLSNKVS